ncbi:MAG: hypothetical protein RL264_1960 [Bacteroidota bacterium]|jgi:pantoate--beta-alanine ligase
MSTSSLVTTSKDLKSVLQNFQLENYNIGFVPTMGALHSGHKKLIVKALEENQKVIVSIFVNPTQFNNANDLLAYPRHLEQDLNFLSDLENVTVFAPSVTDIYPENEVFHPMTLGEIAQVMEGEFRPGHFDGVVHVVHNLFHLVRPQKAYFGKKDYQQLAIIRAMNVHYGFPIEIIAVDTERAENGLALSSRNLRLSSQQLEEALHIWKTLDWLKSNFNHLPFNVLKNEAVTYFQKGKLRLEYLQIVNQNTLQEISSKSEPAVCCIAAYCGEVRLIDNLELN